MTDLCRNCEYYEQEGCQREAVITWKLTFIIVGAFYGIWGGINAFYYLNPAIPEWQIVCMLMVGILGWAIGITGYMASVRMKARAWTPDKPCPNFKPRGTRGQ